MRKPKPEPQPRGKTESDMMDELRKLSITAAHEFLSGFDRLRELREDWETDENGQPTEAKKRREKAKGLAYELARHEIAHAEKILSLSHTHADMLFDHARKVLLKVKSKRPTTARVTEIVLPIGSNKPVGEKFSIRNPFNVEADGRFELESKFRNQSGDEVNFLKCAFNTQPSPVKAGCPAAVHVTVWEKKDDKAKPDDPVIAPGVYFAEVKVFLVADVEQCVARRLLRVRAVIETAPKK